MKRVLSRSLIVAVVTAIVSSIFVGPVGARPRSWFLPQVNVACTVNDTTSTFVGNMQLNGVEFLKNELTVGGTIAGSCDEGPSVDTAFRTPLEVTEATCDEAVLELDDITVKDISIALSEDPIVIESDGPGGLRGALCRLASVQDGPRRALIAALNRVLALQG